MSPPLVTTAQSVPPIRNNNNNNNNNSDTTTTTTTITKFTQVDCIEQEHVARTHTALDKKMTMTMQHNMHERKAMTTAVQHRAEIKSEAELKAEVKAHTMCEARISNNETTVKTFSDEFTTSMTTQDHMDFYTALSVESAPCFTAQRFSSKKHFDDIELSDGACAMLNEPNAGGASEMSEAMSFEILRTCFGAQLEKTEMAIEYEWDGWSKKTDYSIRMMKQKFGVSVTRAMKYRGIFKEHDAMHLLTKKLYGVTMSTRDVLEHDAWTKQLLHIWATDDYIVDVLQAAYNKIDSNLVSNTAVLVTVADKNDWIFTNRSAAFC
jgi:hypothetical protein